ncbi:MAG: acetylornithine deacetylase [Thermoanaerobaculia bacterium]
MATPLLSDEELLARLVAFDTTSSKSTRPAVDFLANYLDRPGLRLDRRPYPQGDKENFVVEVGPEVSPDRRGLVVSGHLDVVPPGDGWSCEPFALTDQGDRWLGRGTADMKGFVALAVNALARRSGSSLASPLVGVFTCDEEVGCLGAGHLADTWPPGRLLPRETLIGEPTLLEALTAHKGHLRLKLQFEGVSAHSGYPHLGVNAIEPAALAVAALASLRAELAEERPAGSELFPDTPYVALNVATISGGSAINMVPDRCEVGIGLRLLPGMTAEPWVERVRQAVSGVLPPRGWHLDVVGVTPPMWTPPEAPLFATLCQETGQRGLRAASYATDGGQLARLGLDTVICGPGTIEAAHKPDEYLEKAQFAAGRNLLDRLISRFCEIAA